MGFFNEFIIGWRAFGVAHKYVIHHKMWKYLLLPGIFHLILLIGITVLAWKLSDNITDFIFSWLGIERINENAQWLKTTLHYLLLFTIRIAFIMLYLSIYKYIVLFIMAPIFAYVSEITEEKLTGKTFPFNLGRFIKDVLRGMLVALRNMSIEAIWLLFLFIFSFIPVIGLLSVLIIFIIQSYFYGFSMIDYYHERHQYSIKDGIKYVRRHKGLAIGIGAAFHLMMLIPIVGWIAAPVYASMAGTIAIHKLEENTRVDKIKQQ